MSEIEKFYNMTKPIKYRKLRLFFKSLDSTYKVCRYKLKYLINYILYKIKILNRYSYRDMSDRVVSLPHDLEIQGVETEDYRALVKMQLVLHHYCDIDYFYRKTRKGTKHITMWVSELDETKIHLRSHLEDIHLCVDDSWYDVSELPSIKIVSMDNTTPLVPLRELDITKPIDIKTVEYDIHPLRRLVYEIGTNCDNILDLTKPRLKYYYELTCCEFIKALREIPISTIAKECN